MNTAYIKRREYGRIQLYRSGGEKALPGEIWIVQSERGIDYGRVVNRIRNLREEPSPRSLIRRATEEDLLVIEKNAADAKDTFRICQEKIEAKELEMKLVRVEYSFDRSRLLFYFTAEGRIDFRELVKELAGIFKTRIEMRQIGVRDEARMMGGVGPCGRVLCCTGFLQDFEPINIRMAKNQRLSLDPDKISGVCGRLFCCLKYEDEFYQACRRHLPKEGAEVKTEGGRGKVVDFNCIRSSVTVEFEDGRRSVYPADQVSNPHPTREK